MLHHPNILILTSTTRSLDIRRPRFRVASMRETNATNNVLATVGCHIQKCLSHAVLNSPKAVDAGMRLGKGLGGCPRSPAAPFPSAALWIAEMAAKNLKDRCEMSDRIFIDNGKASMMYVGEEPWHGLGTKLAEPATAEEAISAANLDWTVKKVPVYAWDGRIAYPIDGTFTVVPEYLWGQETCPTWGLLGRDYTPLQNRDTFGFFDDIVGQGAAIYHTAGALDDGRRVWILAKMPDDIVAAGKDITKKFLLLSNSHDGSGSVQIKFTPVRVVCHNTLTLALQTGDASIRVPHTPDIEGRLEIARQNLELIHAGYDQIAKGFAALAKVALDDAGLMAYLKLVFPNPPNLKDGRAFERVERDRQTARKLFTKGRGNNVACVAGTLWAAYNGISEMIDHGRNRRTPDQHLEHIWFGSGYTLKVRAFEMAKRQIEVAQKVRPTSR